MTSNGRHDAAKETHNVITLESLNLDAADRLLCETGSIVGAAVLLGVTRNALKRRIIKHMIPWPQVSSPSGRVSEAAPA